MLRRLLNPIALLLLLCPMLFGQETVSQAELMEHLLSAESADGGALQYPPLARQARIQGTVVLKVLVDEEGRVRKADVVSGHPMLSPSAVQAAQGWKFRPYVIDEKPTEVEAQITVEFKLQESGEQLTQRFTEDYQFQINQAHACLENYERDFEKAEDHAINAIGLAHKAHRVWQEAQARLLLAEIHDAQKKDALTDYDEAVGLIRQARGLRLVSRENPTLADAYYRAGRFYFNMKNYRSADSAFGEAFQAWRVTPAQSAKSKAQLAMAASMAAESSLQLNHSHAAISYCEVFRRTKSALHGIEFDEANERCRQIH